MTETQIETTAIILGELPEDGITLVNGKPYRQDAKGAFVPEQLVKPSTNLEDEVVRKIHRYAWSLSDQVARFLGHTFTDLGDFEALLQQEYGQTKGGPKGNRSFLSFDWLRKVQAQVSEFIEFGPELHIAKALIDECLNEWASDSRPEIRAEVMRAFNTDKQGQINRSELFMLARPDIDDERRRKVVRAIRDAMRVVGSKQYIRFYERASVTHGWTATTIDLAKA